MSPKFSIVIPTYNRCSYLEKTLDSIISQQEFLNGDVEIVISDNASTDNTFDICQHYVSDYSNILYFRNEKNIRDKNFPLALSRANGILRKLHNDTIIVHPGTLSFFCSFVDKYNDVRPVIFLGNNKDTNSEIKMNFREFLTQEGFRITWIPTFTIWGDECAGIEADFAGCELSLWQVKKLCQLASQKDNIIVNDYIWGVAQNVPQKNISYGLYQVFHENFLSLLAPYEQANMLSHADLELIEKDLLFHFFDTWISAWEKDRSKYQFSETENLKTAVFSTYRQKPYWREYLLYRKTKSIKRRIKHLLKRQ